VALFDNNYRHITDRFVQILLCCSSIAQQAIILDDTSPKTLKCSSFYYCFSRKENKARKRGCWRRIQGSDWGILSKKRMKRRSMSMAANTCVYGRTNGHRVTPPVHGCFLHPQCLNQLHEVSSLPCYIRKKKKDWRSWRVRVWVWWGWEREREWEREGCDCVVVVSRESERGEAVLSIVDCGK